MSHENHFPYEPTDAASAVEDAETAGPSTMEAPGEAEAAPPGPTTNDEHTALSDPSPPATTAAPEQAPHLRTTILPLPAVTTFTGSRNVVVGSVENLNQTIRMREWLDGVPVDRHQLVTADPFVRGESWNAAWKEACAGFADQNTRGLIVVSPRGIGSTTFALQFLARETSDANQLFKLETGWKSPTIGALPGETRRAYQLDLKDPERDRADSAFLQGLSSYADTLASLD